MKHQKWCVDSIDGNFFMCPNEKLNKIDVPNGDIYIREVGKPIPFGLLYRDVQENMKRAKIIIAAPYLLEACQEVLWWLCNDAPIQCFQHEGMEQHDILSKAIKKAT